MIAFLQDAQTEMQNLTPHQKVVAVVLAVVILCGVLELVRRRKLREEYAYFWIGTGILLLGLATYERLLTFFQELIGAKLPTSALFFGALLFLMAVTLQFSIRISRLTIRNKQLVQRVALLEQEVEDLKPARRVEPPRPEPVADRVI